MSEPDYDDVFDSGAYSDLTVSFLVTAASGILMGDNPVYAKGDFLAFYPQFSGKIPDPVIGAFVALASASLQYARWQESWTFGMALFIAHYCTLYLQSTARTISPTAGQILAAGLAQGVTVAKSVGDVSISKQTLQGQESWGAFNLTAFGVQLIQLAKIASTGIMWIY
jgi:hypothetical protein